MEVVDDFLKVERVVGNDGAVSSPTSPIIMEKVEPAEITHLETLRTLQFMDQLRATWKISYPLPEEPQPKDPNQENPQAGGPAQPKKDDPKTE